MTPELIQGKRNQNEGDSKDEDQHTPSQVSKFPKCENENADDLILTPPQLTSKKDL